MRTLKALLAATSIIALPAVAHAEWYLGADAGMNFTQDATTSGNGGSFESSYDNGLVGLGQVGYNFGGPKAEFEVGYRSNDIDKVAGLNASGDTSSWSFMANGLYEFLPQSKFHPFLGAGIGMANVDTDVTVGSLKGTADEWVFAYQGIAGVAYDVTDAVALKAQYRYFATVDYSGTATNGTTSITGDTEYENHSVLVGFTYKFKAPAAAPAPAPAPVAAPAPAPAPKAAPVQKNFMVFFDFNKADITPEAQGIINQAVSTAKAGGKSRVDLTGHADRSGSDKYNMALSLKRANAVKASMVKQGIPADQISVVGKGESAPLVSTADGVREPQNRRVEIVLP